MPKEEDMAWRCGNDSLTGILSRQGHPQLDERKIRLLNAFELWDGPLAGLIEYEGKTYWFDCLGECARCDGFGCDCEDSGGHYFYVAKPLTDAQLAEAISLVGGARGRYLGPNLSAVEAIGWFTGGCNQKFYGVVVHRPGCDGRENCDCVIIP